MSNALWVGLGAFLGAVARYKMSGAILHVTPAWKFPLSTFAINVSGCFAAGVLAGLAEKHHFLSLEHRLFLFTGILGGFTTFSAFGLETVSLFQQQSGAIALAYVFCSVLFGIMSVWIGIRIVP